ncbi:MAG: hypothetical protein IPK83_19395, partial [Planctomycetes bacterium]|nr:hypothetical protein [Planctomycetota bacterium]
SPGDALGRRIEFIDDTNSETKRYYFDGVNEVYEYNDSGDPLRYFVHGVSYIDERLAMVNCYETTGTTDDRPYYYVLDRMYNVRFLVDRAGAIIERYAYDPYGKPLIRESGGRGDTTDLGRVTAADNTRYGPSVAGTIWEPRCDMDDDGDVDSNDTTPYNYAVTVTWPANPTVSQAFSDVGNPYMFQGVPHFAIDTSSSATTVKFPLNHHRARFAEPVTGRWVTRDPLIYQRMTDIHRTPVQKSLARILPALAYDGNPFQFGLSSPTKMSDPLGLIPIPSCIASGKCPSVVECCLEKILARIADLVSYSDGMNWCESGTGVSNILGGCDLTGPIGTPGEDTNNDGIIDQCITWDWDYGQNPEIFIIVHNPNIWPAQPPHLPTPEEVDLICEHGAGGIISDGVTITSVSCPYNGPVGQRP